jgi:hypothetical protein
VRTFGRLIGKAREAAACSMGSLVHHPADGSSMAHVDPPY